MGKTEPYKRTAFPSGEKLLFVKVCLGYALCRTCSELALDLSAFPPLCEELGKLVGLAVTIVVAYHLNGRHPRAYAVPSLLTAVAAALLVPLCFMGTHRAWSPLGVATGAMLGMGTAAAMVQWLERCGTLPIKKIVVAISTAYILNSALVFIVRLPGSTACTVVAVAAAALLNGTLLLSRELFPNMGAKVQRHNDAPARRPRALGRVLPLDVVLWSVTIGLTLSLIESDANGLLTGSTVDVVGRTVPCLIVLLFHIFMPERFDMRYLYGITLPLLIAGLSLSNSSGASTVIAQLFFCMGAAVSRLVAYFVVCAHASQCGVSSLFGCAIVMFLNVSSHNLGAALANNLAFIDQQGLVSTAAVVADAIVVVFLLIKEMDWFSQADGPSHTTGDDIKEDLADRLVKASGGKPLTPREKTILSHMVAGESNAAISDSLFISRGAVRSHTSHIYEKLGIHSRRELEQAVARLDSRGE